MSTGTDARPIFDERSYRLSKDWIRYRGPFGGEGWQNVSTGDVRYVADPPGEIATEDQTQTTLPGEGYELPVDLSVPKWMDSTGDISEVVQDVLPHGARFEITDEWDDGDYEYNAEGFMEAASDWIRENGDSRMAAKFQEALAEYDGVSPWGNTDTPDHLNPEAATEITPLHETDANAGISAGSMFIAEMDHGDRVFLTNTNDDIPGNIDSEADFDAANAAEAANFLDSLGEDVPEHHHEEDEFLAVAEADGIPIREYERPRVSEGKYVSFAATQLLIGNTDAHSENVFYGYGGLQVIDLDLAGTDFEEEPREVAWALGKLYDTAVEAGVYPPYSEESEREFVDNLQRELEAWVDGEAVDDALDAVENEEIRERFRSNIELARQGDLLEGNQEMNSAL